ncbi:O-antigen ligase family protein [Lentisphaerota bacterium WC36G]|nr:O-antigen ligase family protein [Lentisphaerae bacterium WC36]
MILIRRVLFKFTETLFLGVLFIMPIKFGCLMGIPGLDPLFMETNLENIIFFPWNDLKFSFLSGMILLLSIFSVPNDESFTRKRMFCCALAWVCLGAYSILGWIDCGIFVFALLQTVHLLGVGCFVMSGYLLSRENRFFFSKVLSFSVVSGIIIIFIGVFQYFSDYVLMRTLIFNKINYQYRMQTVNVNNIEKYINQKRIIGTFINPNTFAGYLLLIGPIIVWQLNKLLVKLQWVKRFKNKTGEEILPSKKKRYFANILLAFSVLFIFVMLFLVSSRGAFVAFLSAMAFVIFATKCKMLVKILISGSIVLFIGLLVSDIAEESFFNVNFKDRFEYLVSVMKLILKNPFFGSGWRGFYPEYMQLQTQINDIDVVPYAPYNFILSSAVHTGIVGMVLAVFVVTYPLFIGYKALRNSFKSDNYICRTTVVYFGYLSFLMHAMLDFNLQATALVALAGMLAVILVSEGKAKVMKFDNSTALFSRWLLAIYAMLTIFMALLYREHALKQHRLGLELEDINERFVSGHLSRISKLQYRCIDENLSHYVWSPYPFINVAKMLLFTKNYKEAIFYLNRAKMVNDQLPQIYYYLAVANDKLGNIEKRDELLEKLMTINPSGKEIDLNSLRNYEFYKGKFPKMGFNEAQKQFNK